MPQLINLQFITRKGDDIEIALKPGYASQPKATLQ